MANAHSHDHDSHDSSHGSVKSYAIGFILSVILTLIPFGLVMYPTLPKSITLMIVLAFAVIQVLVHLVHFLHLDRSKEQRDNVIAFRVRRLSNPAAGWLVDMDHVQHPYVHDGEVR